MRAREDVAGEHRDHRAVDLQRPAGVEEQLAEGVVVVEVDHAEEDAELSRTKRT